MLLSLIPLIHEGPNENDFLFMPEMIFSLDKNFKLFNFVAPFRSSRLQKVSYYCEVIRYVAVSISHNLSYNYNHAHVYVHNHFIHVGLDKTSTT